MKPIKMESTRNKNTELGRPELPAGNVTICEPPGPECSVTTSGAWASKSPKSSRLGKRKSKWSQDSVGMLHRKYDTTFNRLHKKNAPTMG